MLWYFSNNLKFKIVAIDENDDSIQVIPFEDNNSTELDHQFITQLIFEVDKRDRGE